MAVVWLKGILKAPPWFYVRCDLFAYKRGETINGKNKQ
jgi:hypothetical protein